MCDGCGKKYRVPSADRTYPCKACGGTVSVDATAAPKTTPAREAGTRSATRSSERTRAPAKPGPNIAMWVVVGALVLGGAAYFALGNKSAGMTTGGGRSTVHPAKGEADLAKVADTFADLWARGDIVALGLMIHPDRRIGYQAQLEALAEVRGWLDGTQEFSSTLTPDTKDLGARYAKLGASLHELAEDEFVFLAWQWQAAEESWYVFELSVNPPRLNDRVEAFTQAWNSGDEERIKGFMAKEDNGPAKKIAAFRRSAERRGWENLYKTISNPSISPPERTVRNSAKRGNELDTFQVDYDSAEGPWVFHFKWYKTEDAWCLGGFNPPEVEDE